MYITRTDCSEKALILNLETPLPSFLNILCLQNVYKDVHPKAHQPSNFNDNVHPLHMLQLHITDGLAAWKNWQEFLELSSKTPVKCLERTDLSVWPLFDNQDANLMECPCWLHLNSLKIGTVHPSRNHFNKLQHAIGWACLFTFQKTLCSYQNLTRWLKIRR